MIWGSKPYQFRQKWQIARRIISHLMDEFVAENGSVTCKDLIKLDIRKPEDHARFIDEGVWRVICMRQIEFTTTRLYKLQDRSVWEQTVRDLEE